MPSLQVNERGIAYGAQEWVAAVLRYYFTSYYLIMSKFMGKAGRVFREINHCLASAEVYCFIASRNK